MNSWSKSGTNAIGLQEYCSQTLKMSSDPINNISSKQGYDKSRECLLNTCLQGKSYKTMKLNKMKITSHNLII